MNTYGVVYLTTNTVNSKLYIGQTTRKDSSYLGSGFNIKRAIKKYGMKNFERKTLEECSSQEELNKAEIKWISYYGGVNNPNMYNLESGGNSIGRPCDETRLKISKSLKRRYSEYKHPSTGRRHSEETKRKIGIKGKGRKVSEETRHKISEATSGVNNPNYGKYGKDNPLYGRSRSEEIKHKIALANKGRLKSEETKRKFSEAALKRTEPNGFYGKTHSLETKNKMREAWKRRKIREGK